MVIFWAVLLERDSSLFNFFKWSQLKNPELNTTLKKLHRRSKLTHQQVLLQKTIKNFQLTDLFQINNMFKLKVQQTTDNHLRQARRCTVMVGRDWCLPFPVHKKKLYLIYILVKIVSLILCSLLNIKKQNQKSSFVLFVLYFSVSLTCHTLRVENNLL